MDVALFMFQRFGDLVHTCTKSYLDTLSDFIVGDM